MNAFFFFDVFMTYIPYTATAKNYETISHNVVSSTPRHEQIRTHNLSGDRH